MARRFYFGGAGGAEGAAGVAGYIGAVGAALESAGLAPIGSVGGLAGAACGAGAGSAAVAGALAVVSALGVAGGALTCLAEAAPAIIAPAAMPSKRTLTFILRSLSCGPRYMTAHIQNGQPRPFVAANAEK